MVLAAYRQIRPRPICIAMCAGPKIRHDPRRSAVAVPEPHRQGRARAQAAQSLRHDDAGRICALPVEDIAADPSHSICGCRTRCCPGPEGDGRLGLPIHLQHRLAQGPQGRRPDGRGVGFYFRNVTELLLFGMRGKNARTLAPGRSQVNMIRTRKREHSRKPDEQYKIIEDCSWGPRLEMFSRGKRPGWTVWGNQADESYKPDWPTYNYNSALEIAAE